MKLQAMRHAAAGRVFQLALFAALLCVATHTALAGKAGKGSSAVTVRFDDLLGDAIRSDGLGPYGGSVLSKDGSLKMSTGTRTMFFDFSKPLLAGSIQPFGAGTDSGHISKVSLVVDWGLDGPGDAVNLEFQFVAPAPDGSGPTDWRISSDIGVTRKDTTGDGVADTYILAWSSPDHAQYASTWWQDEPVRDPSSGPRRGPRPKDDGWRPVGRFDMAWGAVVEK
ncbi:MAG: hypothetical protein ACYTGZ_13225 [Planctomycetota bacterium]